MSEMASPSALTSVTRVASAQGAGVKRFLVLEKSYADECEKFDFPIFARSATDVSSEKSWFDHEDAAEWIAEQEAEEGEFSEGDHWYLVAEEGATSLADIKVVRINSSWGGWQHYANDEGRYERHRRQA